MEALVEDWEHIYGEWYNIGLYRMQRDCVYCSHSQIKYIPNEHITNFDRDEPLF